MAPGDEYFTDLLKIEMTYGGDRNTAANIMYATSNAAHGASVPNLTTLASTLFTAWAESFVAYMNVETSYLSCSVADWTSATGLTGIYSGDSGGGYHDAGLPAQVCSLLNLESSMRYRGGRGRIYLPPPGITEVASDQAWTSGYLANMLTGCTGWYDAINGATLDTEPVTWVLYHRSGNKVVAQGVEPVEGVTPNSRPATQRRRVRRVGHIA